MSSPLQLEQRLIEAMRALPPEKHQSVLDFAEFLHSQQNQASLPQNVAEQTNPTIAKEHSEATYGILDLTDREGDIEQVENLSSESNDQTSATSNGFSAAPDTLPLWELFAQISAQVPDEEWEKLPTDLARRFDHYQKQRHSQG